MDDSTNMEGFTAGGDDNDSIGNQQEEHHGRKQRMHRSLPRVKMILEDESYLSGILNALESSGCSKLSYATVNNSWNDAFQQVYATVASDCHLPQGKNRHHKFKEKIVELWAAMERDVLDASKPDKCMEHALYALGMKQLAEYRSIAKSVDRKRQAAGFSPIMEDGSDHAGMNLDAGTGVAGNYGFDGNLSSHKKARFNNDGTHHHVPGTTLFASSQQQTQTADSLLTQMQSTIKRMERVTYHQSGGPPKLPSPLADLHRIICGGTLVNDPSNQQLVMPYYSKCLTAFLTLAQEQANHFTTPNLLAGVLEGLEVLMQHDFVNHQQQDLKQRIQYTYSYVLKAYLKLIDPQVKRTSDTSDNYGNHDNANGSIDI